MIKLKKIFIILAVVGLMLPSFAFAKWGLETASQGTGLIGQGEGVSDDAIPNLIGKVVGVALSFVGAIFFLLILYAGFLWMTAFGSSEKVDKSKEILIHAVIGLIIVLAAYAISSFVFGALTGESNVPETPTGQADFGGCCYDLTGTDPVCESDKLQSECGTPNAWEAGACPDFCP